MNSQGWLESCGQALPRLSWAPVPATGLGPPCRLRPGLCPRRSRLCKTSSHRPLPLCRPGGWTQGAPSARRASPSRSSLSSNSLTSSSCAARPTSARARSRSTRASSRLRSVARSWCSSSAFRVSRSYRERAGRVGGPRKSQGSSISKQVLGTTAPTLGQTLPVCWLSIILFLKKRDITW